MEGDGGFDRYVVTSADANPVRNDTRLVVARRPDVHSSISAAAIKPYLSASAIFFIEGPPRGVHFVLGNTERRHDFCGRHFAANGNALEVAWRVGKRGTQRNEATDEQGKKVLHCCGLEYVWGRKMACMFIPRRESGNSGRDREMWPRGVSHTRMKPG